MVELVCNNNSLDQIYLIMRKKYPRSEILKCEVAYLTQMYNVVITKEKIQKKLQKLKKHFYFFKKHKQFG